jgi:phosphopantetheine--protein transferase-like protein
MDNHEKMRAIVARLCRVEPDDVHPDFSLAQLVSSSINVHLLESALKQHLGIVPPPLHSLNTYSDLEAAILGASSRLPSAKEPAAEKRRELQHMARTAASRAGHSIACGLDVESIASLPAAEDFWTHEFYLNTFTSTEMAYCTRQLDPRIHFGARWCAKEALKKCDRTFLEEKMVNIQVHHDESGAPTLQLVSTQEILPFAVSLSHTDGVAAALVVRLHSMPAEVALPGVPSGISVDGPVNSSQRQHSSTGVALACVFALLSTLFSCAALFRTF